MNIHPNRRRSSNPIIGVAIPSDVYLTYSIFILTSASRVTALPLILQSDDFLNEALSSSVNGGTKLNASTSSSSGPPAYVALLTEPFVPPPILVSPRGVSNPVPAAPPSAALTMLTPDTMRYLGDNVQRIVDQIHEVFLASRGVDMRVQMQKSEFKRQQEKAHELLQGIEKLRGEKQEATKAKLEKVRDGQKALMARIDRILGAMMRNASPEVSEHERKWFEELKRMKNEVVGRGRYDQDSLTARTNLVSLSYLLFFSHSQLVC